MPLERIVQIFVRVIAPLGELTGAFLLQLLCGTVCTFAGELIQDTHFQGGFLLLDPKPGKLVFRGNLKWAESQEQPVWKLAQWNSKYSLEGIQLQRLAGGLVRFANQGKSVTVGKPGSKSGDLILAVSGKAEYGERVRQKGEAWPHLLVSQRFAEKPPVAKLKSVRLHISARLVHLRTYKTPGESTRLHAAQFQIFLNIQNLNRASKGYGDFLYFGIPLYDSRWRQPRGFQQPDAWHKFIYTPPGKVYTSQSLHDGKWVTIDQDVLPLVKEGLKIAWKRGFLKDSRDLADYRVAAMNMGWEVTGILDVAMHVRELSLVAEDD